MINFPGRIIVLVIALICNGCTVKSIGTSSESLSPSPSLSPSLSPSPSSVETATLGCIDSLPNVSVDKDKSSKDVEVEGDKFERQGKGQEALNKYSEAYLLFIREIGEAMGKSMSGGPSASTQPNPSVQSSEFPFKVGRAFAKAGKHEIAITCFGETLSRDIAPPNDASAYLNRGESYLAIGQKTEARQDYQKAANLFQQYKLPQYQKMAADKLRSVTP
jgi:tetratricopeptide (TPR) repeat protein